MLISGKKLGIADSRIDYFNGTGEVGGGEVQD